MGNELREGNTKLCEGNSGTTFIIAFEVPAQSVYGFASKAIRAANFAVAFTFELCSLEAICTVPKLL